MTTPSLSITIGGPGGPMSPSSPCRRKQIHATFRWVMEGKTACQETDCMMVATSVVIHWLTIILCLGEEFTLSFCYSQSSALLTYLLPAWWNWWLLQIKCLLLSSYPLKASCYLNRKYRHVYTVCTGDQLSYQHIDQYQVDHICSPCGKSERAAMNIPIFKSIDHCSYLLPRNPEFQ